MKEMYKTISHDSIDMYVQFRDGSDGIHAGSTWIIFVVGASFCFAQEHSLKLDTMRIDISSVRWTNPAGQPHFAWTKDGDVVVQETGFGPSKTTFVKSD